MLLNMHIKGPSAVVLAMLALSGRGAPSPPPEVVRLVAVAPAESLSVSVIKSPPNGSPTVVLLPGVIGSAYSMRRVTKPLAELGMTTVVIDPLGMGTSNKPLRADYSLTQQAKRIAIVLDSLKVDRTIVVALGTSATIALHFAADQPTRVVGIVSLAGGPVDQQGTRAVNLALKMAPLLETPIGRVIGRRKFLSGVREQSASDSWCTSEVLRAYLAPFERDARASLRAFQAMSRAHEPTPIATRLRAVTAPVHLLMGDKSSPNMPTDAQINIFNGTLHQFRIDTIANTGTMLHEEKPAAVVDAVLKLLAASHSMATP